MNIPAKFDKVSIRTGARLHMGFVDLTGVHFGSVGLAIDAPEAAYTLACSDAASNDMQAQHILNTFCQALQIKTPVSLTAHSTIPRHVGLGSGTQLALAIGAGLNTMFGLGLNITQIAQLGNRGRRSGIGLAAFAQGGFVLDAGKSDDAPPQVVRRLHFPENWRVILVQDTAHMGVYGVAEKSAFQALKPAKHQLRELVESHMLPALERSDLLKFGAYMADLQAYNGDYFAPVQGGCYASRDVESVLNFMHNQGIACLGQSSWGPTGFAIVESQFTAEQVRVRAQEAFAAKPNIRLQICHGRNIGAQLSTN